MRGRPRKEDGTIIRWSNAVRERDGHLCVKCGTADRVLAHHIKTKEQYPELTFDIDNGMTLCKKCHSATHREIKATDKTPRADPTNINITIRGIDENIWRRFRAKAAAEGVSLSEKFNKLIAAATTGGRP